MHQAMVRMDGQKMSKSLGNLVFVHDLAEEWDPRAIRLAVVAHHYRDSWEWHDQLLPTASRRLDAWVAAGKGAAAVAEVRRALDDDLDGPGAVAAIDGAAAAGGGVSEAAALLGVDILG
jgi:L-cysteine:1D-myo-inositol 2-amino-2-deoxy-alpha-D-glucopyranoside ligase